MHIILTAVEDALGEAWRRFCGDLECITVHHGSILDVECDAVVSPANSFGFMDGGIDQVYWSFFGVNTQDNLQAIIKERHHGELVVGTADILPTSHRSIPYLIAAPTMRVPMRLGGSSVNPYLAWRAALLLVRHGVFPSGVHQGRRIAEVVQRIAFPGMGTGVGGISPNICAHQMRAAIEDTLLGTRPFPRTWLEAHEQHQLLYTDRVRNLQRE